MTNDKPSQGYQVELKIPVKADPGLQSKGLTEYFETELFSDVTSGKIKVSPV